jgi:hypothetical protein
VPIFHIVPVTPGAENGWVVKTTHDNGVVEKSVVFATQQKAKAAVNSWLYLDKDWDAVIIRRPRRRDDGHAQHEVSRPST